MKCTSFETVKFVSSLEIGKPHKMADQKSSRGKFSRKFRSEWRIEVKSLKWLMKKKSRGHVWKGLEWNGDIKWKVGKEMEEEKTWSSACY